MIKFLNDLYYGCGVLAFSVAISSSYVYAATSGCIPGNCDGYTKSSSDCSGKTTIKCPFDTSKLYCQDSSCGDAYKYECKGTGISGGSGSPCDGKYASCTCSNGYEWSGGTCKAKSCAAGGYLSTKPSTGTSATYKYVSCNSVSYGGKTCYNCVSNNCYNHEYNYTCQNQKWCCQSVQSECNLIITGIGGCVRAN